MGHDHHFLARLDRLTTEQVDLALSLYRDERLVRYLVERASLKEGQSRFAISLGAALNGPFLVLAENGRFVTCLGAGMSPVGLSVRSRAWLDEAAEAHDELRGRLLRARQATGHHDETAALMRAIHARADRLPREDYRALAALTPVFGPVTWELVANGVNAAQRAQLRLAKLRGPRTEADREVVGAFWRSLFGASTAVLMLAEADDELQALVMHLMDTRGSLTARFVEFGVGAVAYRAARFAASLGEAGIDFYERALVKARDLTSVFDAFLALNALAARRGEFAKRIRGTFAQIKSSPPPGPMASACKGLAEQLLEHSLDEQASMVVKRFLGPDDDLPPDLARTFTLFTLHDSLDGRDGIVRTLYGAALAGRSATEDFFFPEEVLRGISSRHSPAVLLELAKRRGTFHGLAARAAPTEAAPLRNAPCSCGSGKKFKRCCGAARS